jgi:hypothetical protein
VARAVAGVWMLLHLLVVAGIPVVDGLAEHDSPTVAHIEDLGNTDCPTQHAGHGACDLCQIVKSGRVAVASVPGLPVPAVTSVATPTRDRANAPVALVFLDGRSSRAPPLA